MLKNLFNYKMILCFLCLITLVLFYVKINIELIDVIYFIVIVLIMIKDFITEDSK